MKLYSRGQVARRISYGVIVAFILTAVIFFNLGKKQAQKNNSVEKSSEEFTQDVLYEDSEIAVSEPVAVNVPADTSVPVANGQVSYTQDETENINVYRNYNEAVVNINT